MGGVGTPPDNSVFPFLEHFTTEGGEYIWKDEWGGGSCDDFYEPFFNWSLHYLMGGADHMLSLADRQWEAITRQMTRLGAVHKEYGISEDNFHQSEGDICFYNLCLAAPQAINYDPEHNIVMSGLNGSKGAYIPPESGGDDSSYTPLGGSMECYSLPFICQALNRSRIWLIPAKARAMGKAMFDRWRQGDPSSNMTITSVVTNAYLMTGDQKYVDWVVEYTEGWMQRASSEGFIADNVGRRARSVHTSTASGTAGVMDGPSHTVFPISPRHFSVPAPTPF